MHAGRQQGGGRMTVVRDGARWKRAAQARRIAAIDGDVEAGLLELLFDVDLAGFERQ